MPYLEEDLLIPAANGRIAARLDLLLRIVAEVPAAILVVAEVVVLFTGVMARYVFHAPLVWTDELAWPRARGSPLLDEFSSA